jgi:hypothetical protein
MKLLIAIPSKGRADSIFKRTLRWVPRTGFQYKVFVEPQEIEQYRAMAQDGNYNNYLEMTDDDFVDIGQRDQGLGYAKEFIQRYATEHGYQLVFKMDDDVLRFNNRGKNKPDDEMVLEFHKMVIACRGAFERYPDVGAIGFPYRNELFEPKEWSAINARLQSCYLIRTELIQHGFNTLEDFAQYIYIRSQNKVTLRYGLMGIDAADVGKNKGGMQLFDRSAMVEDELARLRAIYPALKYKHVDGKSWNIEPVLEGEFFGIKRL